MPKKPNVTSSQVAEAARKADDLFFDLQAIAEDIRAARSDDIEALDERVRTFVSLARIAADAAGALLYKRAMVDDRDALRKELEARVKAGE